MNAVSQLRLSATSTKARAFSGRTLDADKLDTSIWTDSPADRERKELEKLKNGGKRKQPEPAPISQKDIETRRNVDQYNARTTLFHSPSTYYFTEERETYVAGGNAQAIQDITRPQRRCIKATV